MSINEHYDNKIKEKIIDAFAKNEPVFDQQHWDRIKDRLATKKRKKRILFWSFSAAASLLFAFFVAQFEPQRNNDVLEETQTTRVNNKPRHISQEEVIKEPRSRLANNVKSQTEKTIKQPSNDNIAIDSESRQENTMDKAVILVDVPNNSSIDTIKIKADTATKYEELNIAEAQSKDILIENDSLGKINNDEIKTVYTATDFDYETKETSGSKSKKLSIGVEVSSFASYADQSSSSGVNFSGGLATNLIITNRISFNPGLLLASQRIDIIKSTTEQGTISNAVYNLEGQTNIQLVSIDIPLSLRYKVIKRKQASYFIEIGLSSVIYARQNIVDNSQELQYDVNYNAEFDIVSITESIVDVQKDYSEEPFRAFQPAQTLNFSVGFTYKIYEKWDVSVQPFIKYPLNTVSAQNYLIGSGGIKLQFLF
jgi:hypothetical protein